MVPSDSISVAIYGKVGAAVLDYFYKQPVKRTHRSALGKLLPEEYQCVDYIHVSGLMNEALAMLVAAGHITSQPYGWFIMTIEQWLKMSRARLSKCSKETGHGQTGRRDSVESDADKPVSARAAS